MQNPIQFDLNGTTVDSNYGPSPAIWHDCPIGEIRTRPAKGIILEDFFNDLPLAPTLTTQAAYGKYKAFASSGSGINRVRAINSVALEGGAVKFNLNADEDCVSLGQAYESFLLSGLTSTQGKFWFEAEIAVKSIAAHAGCFFLGLAENSLFTLSGTVPFNDDDAISNAGAMIGFHTIENGVGVVDTVVSDRATSFTNIGAGEGGTMAAYTFTKLGFVVDPYEAAARRVVFYKGGTECATKISHATLTGYTNLNAGCLGPLFACQADSAGANEFYMKWWRCVQLIPGER